MSFFKFLLPYKKTLFFAAALFIIVGVFLPRETLAAVRMINIITPPQIVSTSPNREIDRTRNDVDRNRLRTFTINGANFTSTDRVWVREEGCGSLTAAINPFSDNFVTIFQWYVDGSTDANGWKMINTNAVGTSPVAGENIVFYGNSQIAVNFDPGSPLYCGTSRVSYKKLIQFSICPAEDPNSPDCSAIINGTTKKPNIAVLDSDSTSGVFFALSNGFSEVSHAFNEIISKWSLTWDEFFTQIIVEITNFFSRLFYYTALLCSEIFRYVLNELIQDPNNRWSITRGIPGSISEVFLVAWNEVKMYANMIIVLLLVAIATMMILNYKADEAKRLLWPILLTALLINFSVVLIGLMIDASNILTRYLLVGADQEMSLVYKIDAAYNGIVRPLRFPVDLTGATQYFVMTIPINIMNATLAISFLWFALIIIQRYFVLGMLFIVSPLAFVLGVAPSLLPSTGGMLGKWWSSFLHYLFILIPAAFFLNISVKILTAIPAASWVVGTASPIQDMIRVIFNFTIVIFVFLFGMRMATKSAGPIVTAVMGVAAAVGAAIATGGVAGLGILGKTGLGGLTGGLGALYDGTKGAGKGVVSGAKSGGFWGGVTGGLWGAGSSAISGAVSGAQVGFNAPKGVMGLAKDVGTSTKDVFTKTGEWLNIVNKGTTAQNQQERAQAQYKLDAETKKTLDFASPDQIKKIATGNTYNDGQVAQKIYAIQKMFEDGTINTLKEATKRDLAKYAKASGISSSIITKGQPDLIDLSGGAIAKQAARIENTVKLGTTVDENGIVIKTASEKAAYVKRQALKAAQRDEFARMKIENLDNISDEDIIREAKEKTAKGAQYLQEAVKRKILGMVGNFTEVGNLLKNAKDEYGSSALRSAKKLNAEYVKFDTDAVKKYAKDNTVTETIAEQRLRDEAYKGLDAKEIKDMEEVAFTKEFVDNITYAKISKAGELGLSAKKIKKLQDMLPILTTELAGLTPGSDPYKKLNAKIKAIIAL